jgi:putative ABC transport system permease protein
MVIHGRFILRQIRRARKQAWMFVLCVALSIVTLIALNGFSASVHRSLLNDARALHGGDIIVRSAYDFSPALMEIVHRLESRQIATSLRVYEFYSVVRTLDSRDSLLANLKVVSQGYPFYGRVALRSGRELSGVLHAGSVVVAQGLLDRLHLKIGDALRVGAATLTIEDVVSLEPDQPVSFFSLGPRVLVSAEDLDRLDLVKKGSRVWYRLLLKVHEEKAIEAVAAQLKSAAEQTLEGVDTYRSAESRVKRFFDNFIFFLNLIGVFTLMLAGIGIQRTLGAFLKEKETSIAIMKTVGATSRFVIVQYIFILMALGLLGTVIGLAAGFGLQFALNLLFRELLPQRIELIISAAVVVKGFILGVVVVALFSFLPLSGLAELKPLSILRKDTVVSRNQRTRQLTVVLIVLFFLALVLWQVNDLRTGLYFVAGALTLIGIVAIATVLILRILGKIAISSLVVRQAARGLFRPDNETRAIIVTLGASLTVIFAIYLLDKNLDASFVRSYPADSPNLFFLDIQPDQRDDFAKALGIRSEYYPIVRGRIASINGEQLDRQEERRRRGDNLSRTFYLTYRDHLLDDERIIAGGRLFRDEWGEGQVSVMDTVAEMRTMSVGDRLTFNIQGVPLQARIASIRSRTHESLRPFFYFVFPEAALKDAPQTIFTAVRMDKARIPKVQTEMVNKFPNVSVIDVSDALSAVYRVLTRLSWVIRLLTLLSVAAGLLIVVSSVVSTRLTRIQEAVYYKIVGAKAGFLRKVFALENLLLGGISGALATALSQIASWILCRFVLNITYDPHLGASLLMLVAASALVVAVGLLASVGILQQRPVVFLREQTQE